MEIEFKYAIKDPSVIEKMWSTDVFSAFGSIDERPDVRMKAVYYDTEDGILSRERAAFRIRQEGPVRVAALKWNDSHCDGLFEREEVNIVLENDDGGEPDLSVFSEIEKGRYLAELAGGRKLVEVLRTDFLRRSFRIDTGRTVFEADLDTGSIITAAGDLEICELELELFSGDIEEVERAGGKLSAEYGLTTGIESKFKRGMDLLASSGGRG